MILVAGGTGLLGTCIVTRLTAAGEQVRVLTRDPLRAGQLPARVQVVVGDVRHGPLDDAVDGCSGVVSAVHGFIGRRGNNPATVDRDGNHNLLTAAAAAGAKRFVLVSAAGARADHPLSLHRMKYAAEQELLASNLAGVIVQAPPFLETWQQVIGAKLADGGPALVLGPGRNPINFVCADDVAAFVVLAISGDPRIGSEITVAGPENLTFLQIAEYLTARHQRSGAIKHVPLAALKAMAVLAQPFQPAFARKAHAAVVMNTTDMTLGPTTGRQAFPDVPVTSIDDLARRVASP
ncbi:MAG: hypothetical protein QOK10_1848 [Pseudonocardiales bacterium]|nr:hypothetical protein [Pseudonocardiales bacterium]